MAQAVRSLSPKRIAERIQQHRSAVIQLARRAAIKAVNAGLRAQGARLTIAPPRTIRLFANAYFDVHRNELIAEAEQIIATSPLFARWRLPSANLSSDAQKQSEPKSTTSAVQISCTE
jgi:hypothetical protein